MIPRAVLGNPWVRAAIVLGGAILLVLLIWFLRPVLVPLFFAFLVAYILDPVADALERRGISRSKTVAAMVAVAALLLLAIPLVLVPSIFSQADSLMRTRAEARARVVMEAEPDPAVLAKVRRFWQPWSDAVLDKLPFEYLLEVIPAPAGLEVVAEAPGTTVLPETEGLEEVVVVAPGDEDALAVKTEIGRPEPLGDYAGLTRDEMRAELAERIGVYVKLNARNLLQAYVPTMAVAGQRAGVTVAHIVSSLGKWTIGAIVFLANFALFAFVAAYLLKDFDHLIAGARDLIPHRNRAKIEGIVWQIHLQITSFLRGQLTVGLFLGLMYAVGLTISGTPFSIPIGIFGGLASFVPYLGLLLTMIPAVILTLIAHGIDWHIVGVLVTFGLAQLIESTLLTPKILGDKVGLNPVWVILAVLVFGHAFGFLGILLAVPMAASLKVLVLEGLAHYRASRMFVDSGESGGGS
jgi:predicted PurR-regulated permease PerM